jgi:hypothetical protein
MANDKQDELARAYAMLSSLRKNVAQIDAVSERYVREFHSALDKLGGVEIDTYEFRIPYSELQPKITSRSRGGNGVERISYSKEKYVEKAYLLTKIDAVLGYFKIITSEKPRRMGFSKPSN